jgi:hypothetical protein
MSQPPIEALLRDAATRARGSEELPRQVLERVLRRHRRRRRAAATGGLLGVVAVTALIIGVASQFTGDTSRSPVPPIAHASASKPAPIAHASVSKSPPTPVLFAPLAPPLVPAATGEPATFHGAVGAGDERLAVIDSRSGAIAHYLQSSGSQELSVFNATGTIGYQPSPEGCAATWTATDLQTGAQQPAFTDLPHPAEVALSPTGQRIAYLSVGRQRTVTNPDGTRTPAGCPTARQTLVIADQTTGQEQRLPAGHAGNEFLDLAFNNTASDLALKWHGRIRVLNLANGATSLDQAATLPDPSGCQQHHPLFRPGDDQLLVEADCQSDVEIDGYDPSTLTLDYRHVVTRDPHSILASLAVDPSGKYLIYSVDLGDQPDSPSGAVYAVEPHADRHITNDIYQVQW